jgi:hypothetical protein
MPAQNTKTSAGVTVESSVFWPVVPAMALVLVAVVVAYVALQQGLVVPAGVILVVASAIALSALLPRPQLCFWLTFVLAFFALGIKRYVPLPWGVSIDLLLTISWISVFSAAPERIRDRVTWENFNNPLFWCSAIWMGYIVLQLANPVAASRVAWFYAMRGVALWFFFTAPLVYILLRKKEYLNRFVTIWFTISILGALWAMKQKFIGLDPIEQQWLAAGEADTHVLFGFLRAFSFYSSAAQFGAAQAHALTMAAILSLSDRISFPRRIFYLTTAAFCLVGLALSGMRSPLAIPFVGGIVYIIWSKNWQAMLLSLLVLTGAYVFLRYTWIGSTVQEIHRIRMTVRRGTDLASFEVRETNQERLLEYMQANPTVLWIGGGIGSVGSFGRRFSPNTFLGQFPPDSWYVRIFAETGLLGLLLHIGTLLVIMSIAGARIWSMKDPRLRQQMVGLYASVWGVLLSSYVNPYYGQIPTGIIVYSSYAFLLLAPQLDADPEAPEDAVTEAEDASATERDARRVLKGVHPTYGRRIAESPRTPSSP